MVPSHEELLVRRAREGCRLAFAVLWRRHSSTVRGWLAHSLPSHLADDVVQDIAVAALAGIGSLRGSDAWRFAAWLRAITRNRARTAQALHRRRRDLICDDEHPETWTTTGEALDPLQRREVRDALRRLPRSYRLPLRLRFERGYSATEIGGRLGMTSGSVRVTLCRGLRHLRNDFEPDLDRDAG
jgi:RNA polymerase sigma factor (sigma-70 family)